MFFTFSRGNWAIAANEFALFRYAIIISVQKLLQVIKSNSFLIITYYTVICNLTPSCEEMSQFPSNQFYLVVHF